MCRFIPSNVVIIVGGVHIALRLSSRTPAPAHPRSRGWSRRESAAPAGRGAGDCSHRAAASTQGPKVIQLPVPGARPCARQGAAGVRTAGAGAVLFGAGNRHQAAAAITER